MDCEPIQKTAEWIVTGQYLIDKNNTYKKLGISNALNAEVEFAIDLKNPQIPCLCIHFKAEDLYRERIEILDVFQNYETYYDR